MTVSQHIRHTVMEISKQKIRYKQLSSSSIKWPTHSGKLLDLQLLLELKKMIDTYTNHPISGMGRALEIITPLTVRSFFLTTK
mmetsp:Transcript_18777/g.21588  ORF Transcript_18777/g.21588 Transcript_18777/m.21588 type:complete len:83 (-) Transcript_18777:241-489(-)